MSIKTYALIFGILFVIIGILGFIPALTPDGHLFGLFATGLVHNAFHLITGLFGLLVASNAYYSRMFFKVFGSIYLFLAVLAFMVGSDLVYMHLNHADNLLHLIIGAFFVYLGFGKVSKKRKQKSISTDTK